MSTDRGSRVPEAVFDAARLAAVRATGLLDTGAEESFDRLARLAATVLETPRAFVTIVDGRRSFWKSCIGIDSDDLADRQNPVEESFCQYVVGSGRPLVAGDTANNPVTRDNPSIETMGVAAWAGFPVHSPDGHVLGTFCVVDTSVREWTPREMQVLESLAAAASGEVALRISVDELQTVTATLRETLLPPAPPNVPGWDVAAHHIAAKDGRGVLGDYYDVFESPPGRWWFSLGDVCGHGPPAAKTTALARWSIRAIATRTTDPSEVLRGLGDQLLARPAPDAPHLSAALATAAPRVDTGPRTIHLALAGHLPPRVVRADGAVHAERPGGTVLGYFPRAQGPTTTVTLGPGDALVLFSDGFVEARNGEDQIGEDLFDRALASAAGRHAAEVVTSAVEAVARHTMELRDDAAILVVRHPTTQD